jgi:hypothetical protein
MEKVTKKLVSGFLAFSMLFFYVPTLGAAEPVKISHQKAACIPGGAQAMLQCDVTLSTFIDFVRVYFHSNAYKDDYFVEMRHGAGTRFFAVLPWPDTAVTKGVMYRIVVKAGDGTESSTEQVNVPVSGDCPVSLSDEEKGYASNLVVGLTTSAQPLVPEGFLCKGIVSLITVSGVMKSHEDCRKLLAAGAAGAAGAAVAGIPLGVYVAAAGAAVGAGSALIISNNTGGGGKPVCSCPRPAAQSPTHD